MPVSRYSIEEGELGLSIGSVRPTPLGTNMYNGKHTPVDHLTEPPAPGAGAELGRRDEDGALAKDELNLLAKLIGTKPSSDVKEFKLHLFEGERVEEDEDTPGGGDLSQHNLVNIDLKTNRDRGDLEKVIHEMTVEVEEQEDDDLLALMDKAV